MKRNVDLFASFLKEKNLREKEQRQREKQEHHAEKMLQKRKKKAEKRAGKESRKKAETGKSLVVTFIICMVAFGCCLYLIRDMAKGEDKILLYVAKADIPANYQVTGSVFFEKKEVPLSLVPSGAVKDLDSIEREFTACGIAKGQILTANLFTDKEAEKADLENPVEISVGTSNIADMAGGIIRAGDLVNICVVKNDAKAVYIAEKAYVTRTFTSGGMQISSENTEQSVAIINIVIEASKEKEFNEALESGTLRISRVIP